MGDSKFLGHFQLGGKLLQDDVKIVYVGANFATLVTFYLLLSIKVARVHESVNQMHDAILQTSAKTLSSVDMTALLTSAREFTRNTNITGWGVFVIDRNFLLTSVGMILRYLLSSSKKLTQVDENIDYSTYNAQRQLSSTVLNKQCKADSTLGYLPSSSVDSSSMKPVFRSRY
ncbi:unnamed protein product [Larinioides sclopetarius]|uniref:Uncharacterized protein n=1 Tax=Larinioides sclopetarius TaxID=280406 RepID=A0AAV2BQD3_9ARAC